MRIDTVWLKAYLRNDQLLKTSLAVQEEIITKLLVAKTGRF